MIPRGFVDHVNAVQVAPKTHTAPAEKHLLCQWHCDASKCNGDDVVVIGGERVRTGVQAFDCDLLSHELVGNTDCDAAKHGPLMSKSVRDFDNNPKIYLRQFGADLHRYYFFRTNKFPDIPSNANTGMTFMKKEHCQSGETNCRQSLKQFLVSKHKKSLMRVMAIVCEVHIVKQ